MRNKISKRKLILSFSEKIKSDWIGLTYEELRKKIFELSGVDLTLCDVANACRSIGIDRNTPNALRKKNAKTKFNPWGSCK